ncbi:sigma-70 family RNA polymerase sigma factor [Herbaspirillum lusitanum]|jgi:RNA polymerase sigma-70 factor (ECF subfamily)|uniref:Sigma-70 family RNA polymerase sigma factor n=1 Tax=Herbaspirillum lusitanum TaxID=213312 RepID=A0ABW9AFC5_9BURK
MSSPLSSTSADQSIRDLYLGHHSWLLSRLQRRLNNRPDAEDLASETFTEIVAGPDLQAIREPRAYLTTIAKRLLFHFWRRRELEQAYLDRLARLPETLAPSPEERALLSEELAAIDRVLDGLPIQVKTAFLYSQLDGMGHQEIADLLGVSLKSVGRYLKQAMCHCYLAQAQLA